MIVVNDLPDNLVSDLRNILLNEFEHENSVRAEGYRQALSAALHRLAEFGVEDTFNNYSALDLLNMILVGSSMMTTFFIRTAAIRALLEEDQKALAFLHKAKLTPYLFSWCSDWMKWDIKQAQAHLEKPLPKDIDDRADAETREYARQLYEEAIVSRIVLGRRFPQLIQAHWLWECPKESPLLGMATARLIIDSRSDLFASVRGFLRDYPEVLLCRNPDELLAPLVARSNESPQVVLAAFEGYYDEATVAAAAEWHLEHQQGQQAIELCRRIRPLSKHYDRALLINALAHLEYGDVDTATRLGAEMLQDSLKRVLQVHLAEHEKALMSDDDLHRLSLSTSVHEAQLFYRCLVVLLNRKRLDLAKDAVLQSGEKYNDHQVIKEITHKILGG